MDMIILKILFCLIRIVKISNTNEICAEFHQQTNCYCDSTYLICDNTNQTQVPSSLVPRQYFKQVSFRNTLIKHIKRIDLDTLLIDATQNGSLNKRILYNLDFDGVSNIDDSSFEGLTRNLISSENFNLKFRQSNFALALNKRPFKGLRVNILSLQALLSDYIANPLFDDCNMTELHIDDSPNFIGFIDLGDNLPTGRIQRAYYAHNSYRDSILCSHSLPAFIDHEHFSEINIQVCKSIQLIKSFAFYKYNHLKILILSSNNISLIERHAFRNLNDLEFLSLSYNPLVYLPDYLFSDLISLKRLDLEGTDLKFIAQKTFAGLFSLTELRFTFCKRLSHIENGAFEDSKKNLKVIFMENTDIQLISSSSIEWLSGLNLTNLVVDFSNNRNLTSTFFTDFVSIEFCHFIKLFPKRTLINLNSNEDCSCLIYWLYQHKDFQPFYTRFSTQDSTRHWIYATPRCYRLQTHNPQDRKRFNFSSIIENEKYCNFRKYELKCLPTTSTRTSTTTSSISSSTTSMTTSTQLTTTAKRREKPAMSKIDGKKLFYVIITIILISVLAVLFTIVALKLNIMFKERQRNLRRRRGGLAPRAGSYLIRNPKQTSQRSLQSSSIKTEADQRLAINSLLEEDGE